MKKILILCLIISLNCNLIDTGLCLFRNEKLRHIASDVIDTIKEKNWMKAISIVMMNFEEIKSIFGECLHPEPVPEQPKSKDDICDEKCGDIGDYHDREDCYKDCLYGA